MAAMQEAESFIIAPHSTEDEVEARELASIIKDFLHKQTAGERVIFMRRCWFADPHSDIAEMGLSEKNISVRFTRIRKKLKDHLRETLV